MPPDDHTTQDLHDLVTNLAERFDRVERAILGDEEAGHLGAIARLNAIDREHLRIPETHQGLDDRRISGDRRLHERLDNHEEETARRIAASEEAARAHRLLIERKIDRLIWWTAGSFAGGAALGWGLAGAPLP